MERNLLRSSWIEVSINALQNNLQIIRAHLGPQIDIMAIVKANGYGLGAIEVSRVAIREGAACLGVATIEEGIELRDAGIKAPILILGYAHPESAAYLINYKLTPAIFNKKAAQALSKNVSKVGCRIPVHVKIDTGMTRLGVPATEVFTFLEDLIKLPGFKVEGIFTHLSSADDIDTSYTQKQLCAFSKVVNTCNKSNLTFLYCHVANSAAIIAHNTDFNMVRLGLSMYGFYPDSHLQQKLPGLEPAISLKSQVVHLTEAPAGTAIGYGRTYVSDSFKRIATVPIGYGDGYSRANSNCGNALIGGKRVPIVGRVCMDHIMLDVTYIKKVSVGDEVVLYGEQDNEKISVDDVANSLGTINYEVISTLSKRIPRFYLKNGEVTARQGLLGHSTYNN